VLFEQWRAHVGNPLFLAISLERNTPPHRWLGCWVVGGGWWLVAGCWLLGMDHWFRLIRTTIHLCANSYAEVDVHKNYKRHQHYLYKTPLRNCNMATNMGTHTNQIQSTLSYCQHTYVLLCKRYSPDKQTTIYHQTNTSEWSVQTNTYIYLYISIYIYIYINKKKRRITMAPHLYNNARPILPNRNKAYTFDTCVSVHLCFRNSLTRLPSCNECCRNKAAMVGYPNNAAWGRPTWGGRVHQTTENDPKDSFGHSKHTYPGKMYL